MSLVGATINAIDGGTRRSQHEYGTPQSSSVTATGLLPREYGGHLPMKHVPLARAAASCSRRTARSSPPRRRGSFAPRRGRSPSCARAARARARRRAGRARRRPPHPRGAARRMKTLVVYLMAMPDTPALARGGRRGAAPTWSSSASRSPTRSPTGPVIRRAGERALAAGMRTGALPRVPRRDARARRRAARPDDVRVAPRRVRLGALRDRRARGGRDVADRRRPARRRASRAAARPARRADLDRRAPAPRRRRDRRLAVPRHRRRARPARAPSSPPRSRRSPSAPAP